MIYIKPEIKFPLHPFINLWIDAEYRAVKTYDELIEFTQNCFKKSDESENEVRKEAYKKLLIHFIQSF